MHGFHSPQATVFLAMNMKDIIFVTRANILIRLSKLDGGAGVQARLKPRQPFDAGGIFHPLVL